MSKESTEADIMGNSANKWSWTEPTNEEFDAKRRDFTFFRIYVPGEDKDDEVLYKFWAKSRDEAISVLEEYKKDHPDEKRKLFYSTSGYLVDPDGKRHDDFYSWLGLRKKKGWFKKVVSFVKYNIFEKARNFWFEVKDTWYFIRHKHSMTEYWSIDCHILDDLVFNLDRLSRNVHGCPTRICDEVRKSMKKGTEDDDAYDTAMEIWKKELSEFREHILLYMYYRDYGIIHDTKLMGWIDEKYRDTLPYLPETNKEFDYQKLSELTREQWNIIWDTMKRIGEELWD